MTDTSSSDKTPILLHPARRLELLRLGQEHFNNDRFGDAIEMWHQLLNVEQGRDKEFVKMLLDCAGHFADLKKSAWDAAEKMAQATFEKLSLPAAHGAYRDLDLAPVHSALDYNLGLLRTTANKNILVAESFI
ncbi:MAG TPA: hypothetical protein PLH57_11735, partial [Oligoflexia bacterium]|nr:hypothetical protein [Oligoflexia bacterium]